MTLHEEKPVQVKNEKLLFDIIHASFNQRRKTLVNGLTNAAGLSFSKDEIIQAIENCGFTPTIRGEALTLAQSAQLADTLVSI